LAYGETKGAGFLFLVTVYEVSEWVKTPIILQAT